MAESRMERNRLLREKIEHENMVKRKTMDQNSLIYATFEKIKQFDKNDYFKKKIENFDKIYETDKPYLDKDREKNPIPDNFIPELKNLNESILEIKDTPVAVISEKYEKYDESVIDNFELNELAKNVHFGTVNFSEHITKLEKKKKSEKVFWTEAEKKEELKSLDDLFVHTNVEINKKYEEYIDDITKKWKDAKIGMSSRGYYVSVWILLVIAFCTIIGLAIYIFI